MKKSSLCNSYQINIQKEETLNTENAKESMEKNHWIIVFGEKNQ